ncbi:hypothetical protein HPB49_006210 [Dermacentor silvarum]|uniref:Uncharacterized protein n=1 Tax=Dermacentor silvarum TaxID=543639 RepID=A0ACB8C2C5_DERSI|nr:hypothetical protein HPB49_006210 [Dermacentor silvarum]
MCPHFWKIHVLPWLQSQCFVVTNSRGEIALPPHRFNPGHQAVYVPFGIVNTSVPGNGTVFAFELSRMATRLYAALVPVLFEDGAADESALLRFTDHALRKLDELLDCLAHDYRNMPLALREGSDDGVVDPDRARYVLLAQTAAVLLAHAAFKELLHVKRIWKYDFRFAPLPDLTSEQLFFAYFARDNCECSDDAHKAHSYVIHARLPPEQRVNFALRHLPAFGEAFHCSRDAPMRPLDGAVCRVRDYPYLRRYGSQQVLIGVVAMYTPCIMPLLWVRSAGRRVVTGIPAISDVVSRCSVYSGDDASAAIMLFFVFTRTSFTPGSVESACAMARREVWGKAAPLCAGRNNTVRAVSGVVGTEVAGTPAVAAGATAAVQKVQVNYYSEL